MLINRLFDLRPPSHEPDVGQPEDVQSVHGHLPYAVHSRSATTNGGRQVRYSETCIWRLAVASRLLRELLRNLQPFPLISAPPPRLLARRNG